MHTTAALLFALAYALATVLMVFYAERKLAAFFQDRLGPMYVGPYGLLQAVADVAKLMQKAPTWVVGADRLLFFAAPVGVFASVFAGFAVVPLMPGVYMPIAGTAGVFYLLAIVAPEVVCIWLAGVAGRGKYALLGAGRAVAQLISYEVPLGLAVLGVAVWAGTLSPEAMATGQGAEAPHPLWLAGIPGWADMRALGGITCWHIVQCPWLLPLLPIFYLATLAECNRAPFDLPEGESEIVGGFHTEYSGFAFGLFFLSEYALMVLISLLGIFLFLGGTQTPLPNLGPLQLAAYTTGPIWGLAWLSLKLWLWLFSHLWMRWTLPRLRIDQLLKLGWQVLTPLALLCLLGVMLWRWWGL